MSKEKDFISFLSNIEPSTSTVEYISSIQNNLRDFLKEDEDYKSIYKDTFLSGSYAKHTAIRPTINDNNRDVDIIVVTNHSKDDGVDDVFNELHNVLLKSKHYDSAVIQHHSIGIEMSEVNVDLVPVIADEFDEELFYVGDTENDDWIKSDPKGHKKWSSDFNVQNNNAYKPLVKIFKWWRHTNCPKSVKYPKGITLEKIVADNIGDSSLSTEDLLIGTMQNIVNSYKELYCEQNTNPIIYDPSRKVMNNNLLEGYSVDDFKKFVNKIDEHINFLNENGTNNETWKKILGNEFPSSSNNRSNELMCINASHKLKPSWLFRPNGAVIISIKVRDCNGNPINYSSNDEPLEKNCDLEFRAITGVKKPFKVYWQIVNTGSEAIKAGCLRGGFDESSNANTNVRLEKTEYSGSHSIQCFVIKNGYCVAKSKEYIVNIK